MGWVCPECAAAHAEPALCCSRCGARWFGRLHRTGEGEGVIAPSVLRRVGLQLGLLNTALLPLMGIATALSLPFRELHRSLQ